MAERIPAEVFSPSLFIREEMDVRGWSDDDFRCELVSIGCTDAQVLACELSLHVADKNLIMDEATARNLGKVFDIDPQFFINLDRLYRGEI